MGHAGGQWIFARYPCLLSLKLFRRKRPEVSGSTLEAGQDSYSYRPPTSTAASIRPRTLGRDCGRFESKTFRPLGAETSYTTPRGQLPTNTSESKENACESHSLKVPRAAHHCVGLATYLRRPSTTECRLYVCFPCDLSEEGRACAGGTRATDNPIFTSWLFPSESKPCAASLLQGLSLTRSAHR